MQLLSVGSPCTFLLRSCALLPRAFSARPAVRDAVGIRYLRKHACGDSHQVFRIRGRGHEYGRRICGRSLGTAALEKDTLHSLGAILSLDADDLARITRRHPELVTASIEEVEARLNFLRDEVPFCKAGGLATLVRQNPHLLSADVGRLGETLALLRSSLPEAILSSTLEHCPDVLLRAPGELVELQRAFESIGVSFERIVKRTPRMLMRDASAVLRVYDFLIDADAGPGMSRDRATTVASSYPMLLIGTRDPMRQLAPLVRFLRETLRVDPASDACVGFYAWPDALGTIEPVARFLMDTCSFALDEVQADVSLLGHSLEARAYPRFLYAKQLGAPKLSIRSLTAIDDRLYCQVVGAKLEDYQEFARQLRKAGKRGP